MIYSFYFSVKREEENYERKNIRPDLTILRAVAAALLTKKNPSSCLIMMQSITHIKC